MILKISKPSKNVFLLTVSFLFLVLFFIADILLGSIYIPVNEIFNYFIGGEISEEHKIIITQFRLPKTITAVVVGAALSVAGLQMQTIFRNPLAGPYVLGISSGASLGVAILVLGFSPIILEKTGLASTWIITTGAWLGAGSILILIFIVSARVKDVMTILILGVLFGSAVSAVVSIFQYFGNETDLKLYILWTMGSLAGVTYEQLYVLVPSVIVGIIISIFSVKILNLLLLGENYAKSSGLNILKARLFIFLSTSLLAGTVTAFCGPVGFVGIIVPHLARMIFKTANHNILLPASAILGAIIILFSDIVSQMPGYKGTLPLNSVTAIVGIPIVIKIIISRTGI